VSGQDGWYLAEQLLGEGHDVHGIVRDPADVDLLGAQLPGLQLHVADITDTPGVQAVVREVSPSHLYNLAGSTSVARSWVAPAETSDVIGGGAIRLLSAAWDVQERLGREIRFLQASSAEIFGDPTHAPQDEQTERRPVTPYGAAKDFAHTMVEVYRKRGMFASAAILYNHESPRRPASFVARKITRTVAAISRGSADELVLGNIDVLRDWGYAPDHVNGLVQILAAPEPGDFVVATGQARSVRDFVEAAFLSVGIEGWERYLRIDPTLYRPADPQALVGDASRLRALGWEPRVGFEELVRTMVTADLRELDAATSA
jgi:GDPmannose 4,6-dehydratase